MTDFPPLPAASRWRVPLGVLLIVPLLAALVLVVELARFQPTIVYRIEGGVLEVRGGNGLLGNHRRIPLASLSEVSEVTLGGGRRVAGTGLPGYCAGRFSYDRLGSVWQVTDCSRCALMLRLTGEERPILLTPPDRAALGQALRDGRDGDFSPPTRRPPLSWVLFISALPLLVVPLAVYTAAAFFVAPGKLRYRVGSGQLEVQLLLVRRRFPLAGARARRHTPRRVWKLAGSALPGYLAGSFRADGVTTRIYATTARQEGVLLERGRRVFVTPADVPGFLQALERQGARIEG